jgi:hypothetical protein
LGAYASRAADISGCHGPWCLGNPEKLLAGFTVLGCVVFGGLLGVLSSVKMVPVRYVRGIGSLFVVAGLVVIGSFFMVLGCVLVMLCCLAMMVRSCMISHIRVSFSE